MSGDEVQQYIPYDKMKVYKNNVLVSNLLRKLNFGSAFSLTENPGTGSIDFGVSAPNVNMQLDDLTDVTLDSPTDNQFLRHDGTDWKNETVTLVDTVNSLTDAVITTPSDGQVLTYDSADQNWKNETLPSAAAPALDDLTDVVISSPTDLQVLRRNHAGSNWINASLDSERVGLSQANGNGSTTLFNIAHGLGSTPTYAFISVAQSGSAFIGTQYTVDSTNIAVTFASAPASGTNNVKIYWRVVA
jgi:hypothetical protein